MQGFLCHVLAQWKFYFATKNYDNRTSIYFLTLDLSVAQNIVNSVSSDKVVIVCKDAEKDIIVSLLTQIGWRNHIQSVVTEQDLIDWYEKALRGTYADLMGDSLLLTLRCEIAEEFPSLDDTPEIIANRHYENCSDDYWVITDID